MANRNINIKFDASMDISKIKNSVAEMQKSLSNVKFSQVNNKKFLGYLGVSIKEEYLFLSKLYIKKEFRSFGYGKLAFEEIKQIALENNKKSIRLTVNKNNLRTINAYKKWGFKTIDSVVTDIGNNFVMDDYIMEFRL